nr:Arm DNA-binding domain-containing protein [Anaerostipes hadrus]
MWEVRTYYKDLIGARKQKTKRGFAKKSEALEWERNFKLKEDQSISMSFKSFVDIYLTFWCRGYYVDTVGKNAKKIQEYIQNQLQNDLEYD